MYHYRDYRKKKKRRAGKIAATLFTLLLILLIVVVIKTLTYPFAKQEVSATTELVDYRATDEAIERLAHAIRIPTISEDVMKMADNPFDQFNVYLPEAFPEVYASMDTLTVNKYGLLFRWKGKDSSRHPILFLAHYDVVPVAGYESEDDSLQLGWDYPPFSGAVANERLYGRGALDAKSMLTAQMEAATALLADSFMPEQDIWFAYGFDEETGGTEGAARMVEYFKQQHITFDAVYDEGSVVVAPGFAGIGHPLALVGVAEKGFCTLNITVRGMGGHSSMPPRKSSLVLAAEIIEKLNSKQLPAEITPPIASFLDRVGGGMNFMSRLTIANQWLLEKPLINVLENSRVTNALIRTTTAITMAKGSDAANVLSSFAGITVNFRILTGQTVEDVVNHVKHICAGYDVDIEVEMARQPSTPSSEDTPAFRAIKGSMAKLYPEAVVAAYIALTGTDAQKYEAVSSNVYRIMPVLIDEDEQRSIHNENEYISLENYGKMIAYYKDLMRTFETVE